MIRLTASMAKWLVVLQWWLGTVPGYSTNKRSFREDIFYRYRKAVGDNDPIVQSILNNGLPMDSSEEISTFLLKQLDESKKAEMVDLVSTVRETLKGQYGLNILSGENLKLLRQLLLTPIELQNLRASMLKLSCQFCGTPFEDGEMATIAYRTAGSRKDDQMVAVCVTCAPPTKIACRVRASNSPKTCIHKSALSAAFRQTLNRIVSRAKCSEHAGQKESQPEEGVEIFPDTELANPFEDHHADNPVGQTVPQFQTPPPAWRGWTRLGATATTQGENRPVEHRPAGGTLLRAWQDNIRQETAVFQEIDLLRQHIEQIHPVEETNDEG